MRGNIASLWGVMSKQSCTSGKIQYASIDIAGQSADLHMFFLLFTPLVLYRRI